MSGFDPILIGEIKKYIENNISKVDEKMTEELLQREEEITKKIAKMKIDPEAQEKAKIFLDILRARKEKGFSADPEAIRLITFALYYLIKKHDLIPDWHPIVGYDDDAAMVNYVYNEVVSTIADFKKWQKEQG